MMVNRICFVSIVVKCMVRDLFCAVFDIMHSGAWLSFDPVEPHSFRGLLRSSGQADLYTA